MSHQVDFRLERAVELFPEECHHRFSPQERFEGTEVVSWGKKARMFPTLPEDEGDDSGCAQAARDCCVVQLLKCIALRLTCSLWHRGDVR
jgi:hypothetical protein